MKLTNSFIEEDNFILPVKAWKPIRALLKSDPSLSTTLSILITLLWLPVPMSNSNEDGIELLWLVSRIKTSVSGLLTTMC